MGVKLKTENTIKCNSVQTLGAKVESQKGNSPDHPLRSLKVKVKALTSSKEPQEVGLEAAIF